MADSVTATSTSSTPSTDGGGGTNYMLYGGIVALIITAGVAYWWFKIRKPADDPATAKAAFDKAVADAVAAKTAAANNPNDADAKALVDKTKADADTAKEALDKANAIALAATLSGSTTTNSNTAAVVQADMAKAKGTSPVRTDHDGAYNYQKRSGVWYSASKKTPDTWSSWGIDSSFAKNNPTGWAQAVADLDAKYPND